MDKLANLIHVGRIAASGEQGKYLYLRKINPHSYSWFEESEKETSVNAFTIEEALRLANRTWKSAYFRMVNCGFRYTLPERDEHGINALFYQMVASYTSFNGIYFDEEIGCNCFVQFASDEAKYLWKLLKANEKSQ